MPVTVKPAAHEASLVREQRPASHPLDILNAMHNQRRHVELFQSSFDHEIPPKLLPDRNGFAHAVTQAYNNHHHLIIRPDDIWLAITTQFSSYVNAHAEELRSSFVAHEGQKELVVVYGSGNRYTVDFADFAQQIGGLIEGNILDPELREWITPKFTTTTRHDVVVASIIMMGTLQAYFKYRSMIMCGIPSVTLLGEKQDYQLMLDRIEKLCQYGEEPSAFCSLLRPIMRGFVRTFEEPGGDDVAEFWKTICDFHGGSGIAYYTGWITAFCFWDTKGRRQITERKSRVDANDIPSGFTKVPVAINDNGEEIKAEMLAGSVGIRCSSSGRPSAVSRWNPKENEEEGPVGTDTMQPQLGWFIYETAGV